MYDTARFPVARAVSNPGLNTFNEKLGKTGNKLPYLYINYFIYKYYDLKLEALFFSTRPEQ